MRCFKIILPLDCVFSAILKGMNLKFGWDVECVKQMSLVRICLDQWLLGIARGYFPNLGCSSLLLDISIFVLEIAQSFAGYSCSQSLNNV